MILVKVCGGSLNGIGCRVLWTKELLSDQTHQCLSCDSTPVRQGLAPNLTLDFNSEGSSESRTIKSGGGKRAAKGLWSKGNYQTLGIGQ